MLDSLRISNLTSWRCCEFMAQVRYSFISSPYRNRRCQAADEHVEADRDKAKIVGQNLGESDHGD